MLTVAAVFALALVLCLQYQRQAVPEIEVRADAAKYLTAAFNLRVHRAYSLDPPSQRAPATRTDLAPGYPVFLALLMTNTPDSRTLIPRVQRVQALLAAASAGITVLLAAMALPLWAAAAAGVLAALNPHLIALSAAMLTETLFVFLLMLGLLLFSHGWTRGQRGALFLAALALGLAAEVRTIGFVLPLALAALTLVRPAVTARGSRERVPLLAAVALGAAAVIAVHQWFSVTYARTPDGSAPVAEYVRFSSPLSYLATGARPPHYVVAGESHSIVDSGDPAWRQRTEASPGEAPLAYLEWNLWERWRVMWDYRGAYTGNAEPYPMRRSAFAGGGALAAVEVAMRWLHWPLLLFTLAGAALIGVHGVSSSRYPGPALRMLLPACVVFVVFVAALAVVDWLPRYTVPLRPVSYDLAMAALVVLVQRLHAGPARRLSVAGSAS